MNWSTARIQEVSDKAREQQPYGTHRTLLFGLTMTSFFIVTYMLINNFAFRYAYYCFRLAFPCFLRAAFPLAVSASFSSG